MKFFNKPYKIIGSATTEHCRYYHNQPHYGHPYDVDLKYTDEDSFAFIIESNDNKFLTLGEPGETCEQLITKLELKSDEVLMKGRVWKNTKHIFIEYKNGEELYIKDFLLVAIALSVFGKIHIGDWTVLTNSHGETHNTFASSRLQEIMKKTDNNLKKQFRFISKMLVSKEEYKKYTDFEYPDFNPEDAIIELNKNLDLFTKIEMLFIESGIEINSSIEKTNIAITKVLFLTKILSEYAELE